jgi:hypothetical protein
VGRGGKPLIQPKKGMRFGRLTTTGRRRSVKSSGGTTRSQWSCRCDCGVGPVWVDHGSLRVRKTISCGCMQGNPAHSAEAARRRAYRSYRTKAKARRISFRLTRIRFYALILQPCYYCGSPPSRKMYKAVTGAGRDGLVCNGVDRVNNKRGYTVVNSVACCSICNWMKNTTDYHEWIKQMKKIINHLRSRKRAICQPH